MTGVYNDKKPLDKKKIMEILEHRIKYWEEKPCYNDGDVGGKYGALDELEYLTLIISLWDD